MGYTLYYTVISMSTDTQLPLLLDGKLLMAGTLKELSALQWGQMKRVNPLPPGLSQINTTAVFIHCTIGYSATFSILMWNFVLFLLICLYIFFS